MCRRAKQSSMTNQSPVLWQAGRLSAPHKEYDAHRPMVLAICWWASSVSINECRCHHGLHLYSHRGELFCKAQQPAKISERSILCFRVAALFLCPPAKFSSSLHSPTVFCKFTSKMVGGFLLLQARSCFLKFFRICRVFVAFSGPFSAYKNRKAHDLHRAFNGQSWVFLWCARGNSNPWPSD